MLTMALIAAIVPAVVAAAVVGVGRAVGGRGGAWLAASAVGLGYVAGHFGVARPAFPPVEVTDRIPWLALAASALAVFEAMRTPGTVARGMGRSVLAVLTLWLILGPVVAASGLSKSLVISGLVALAAWVNLEALAAKPGGHDVLRSLLITAAGAGIVLLVSGSAVPGFSERGAGVGDGRGLARRLGEANRGPRPRRGGRADGAWCLKVTFTPRSRPPAPCCWRPHLRPAGWHVSAPLRRLGPWASVALGTVAVLVPVGIAVGLSLAWASPSEY